jgi:hypothetical protein
VAQALEALGHEVVVADPGASPPRRSGRCASSSPFPRHLGAHGHARAQRPPGRAATCDFAGLGSEAGGIEPGGRGRGRRRR